MKLPVLVFVQGGGYTRNANANWNGTELVLAAERDLVLVNFNYRVGLWGFLAGAEVAADGALNAGMLDQRLLLHWVQQHIPSFGGDPAHVVIHGVSAGAGSVALHLAAYGGRNDSLFHAAISESTFIPAHPPFQDLEYQLDQTMAQAGCADAENRMACLRSRTKDQLQSLNVPAHFPGRDADPLFYWTPCVDGDFMQKNPAISFAEGSFITVPVLFGTCSNGRSSTPASPFPLASPLSNENMSIAVEGSMFAPSDAISSNNLTDFFEDNFPNITPDQSEAILEHYPLEPTILPHSSWFPSISRAYGEAIFICPSYNILNALLAKFDSTERVSSQAKLWSYRYNVIDDTSVVQGHGVPHVFEVAAVFGPDMLSYPAPASYYTYNAEIVPVVQSYIASFARTFDPNIYKLDTAPTWSAWDENHLRMLLQTGLSAMEVVEDDERNRCEFWKDLGVTMNQ
jgi:acetylcholinesterase